MVKKSTREKLTIRRIMLSFKGNDIFSAQICVCNVSKQTDTETYGHAKKHLNYGSVPTANRRYIRYERFHSTAAAAKKERKRVLLEHLHHLGHEVQLVSEKLRQLKD